MRRATPMPRAPLFCSIQPPLESSICSLVDPASRDPLQDAIPVPRLCTIIDSICPTITVVINVSLATGIVHKDFKSAIVKPILKEPSLIPEN